MSLNDGLFLPVQDDHEIAVQDVTPLLILSDKVLLVDLFGKHRDINGTIQQIDLLNNRIVLG